MLNIEELRNKIDDIDEQIFTLLDKRFAISKEVGKYKAENGIPILNETREAEILAKIQNEKIDNNDEIAELYNLIFLLSKRMQK